MREKNKKKEDIKHNKVGNHQQQQQKQKWHRELIPGQGRKVKG